MKRPLGLHGNVVASIVPGRYLHTLTVWRRGAYVEASRHLRAQDRHGRNALDSYGNGNGRYAEKRRRC